MTWGKRVFDILASALGLALTAPLFAVVALAIKLDDGGPVFFRQDRVGYRGRGFKILKFRTMRTGDGAGALLTVGEDPRITRAGQWLRRFKLDELPQLLNVLVGEMSMVGPRPEVPRYVAFYTPDQQRVLELVPGITDPASLRFWHESELLARSADPERTYVREVMPEKIRLQLDYGLDATVWRDFLVTVDTVRRMWPSTRPLLVERVVRHRRPFILLTHALLVLVGYRAAYWLRFDFHLPPEEVARFWATVPILLAIRLATYAANNLFSGHWQHFGVADLVRLCRAVTLGTLVFVLTLVLLGSFIGMPRSVLLLDWAGAIFLSGGVRLAARSLREGTIFPRVTGRRTLVVGTGDKAERLLREVRRDANHPLRVLGLVLGRPSDPGDTVQGYPILGNIDQLPALVTRHRVEFVVIALDESAGEFMERVADQCLAAGVDFKTLPSMEELLEGAARADQLRNVRIDDLLGRDSVRLDLTAVEADLRDRVVLVTGGAGSIGSELARQIGRMRPARLVLVDQAETPLYFMHLELTGAHRGLDVVPVICDITDEARVARIFEEHRPDYVIHAAAYKHVPMMEDNFFEAVRNNVFGTVVVAEAAVRAGARKFVLISTDKAVNPSSIMGATKRIAERIALGLPTLRESGTDFRAVRFGNVLGSAGSVVPLFQRQLETGGPLTVTHRDVERYFMTIPEAAQLVLQAAALPEAAGRVVMLDMGRPVRILNLAEKLIRLAGLEPYRDVRIVFTGLRPGEKLHEELMAKVETTGPSTIEQICLVRTQEPVAGVADGLNQLAAALAVGDSDQLLEQIRELVPEAHLPRHPARAHAALAAVGVPIPLEA